MGIGSKLMKAGKALKFKAMTNSPEIFFIAGTVVFVCTIVSAVKRGPKFKEIMDLRKEDLKELEEKVELVKEGKADCKTYTRFEQIKDRIIFVDGKAFVRCVRELLPTFALGISSVLLYAKGFGILKGWYIGASAALAKVMDENERLHEIIDKGKDAIGEDITYGDNGEAGDENDIDAIRWPYEIIIDKNNPIWDHDMNHTRNALIAKENLINLRLNTDGVVTYNQMCDDLWAEEYKCDEGMIIGNVKYKSDDEARANGSDNIVTLRIDEGMDEKNGIFILRPNIDRKPIPGRAWYSKKNKEKVSA